MALLVYVLCLVTATACSVVLFAASRRRDAPLLWWSSMCFAGLAANDALVLLDLYVVLDVSLLMARRVVGFLAVLLMLVGLIFHKEAST
jgi:hypothetical protein